MIASLPPDDPTLGLIQTLQEDGTVHSQGPKPPADAVLVQALERMLQVRVIDDKMLGRQRQGRVGFYGTVTGQEAVPVATGLAAGQDDWIFPALRESAIMLVRGFDLKTYLAQVYGNEGDLLKGRQMPSHMSARAVHQVSWSSCIANQLPQAVGAAMAARQKGDPIVTLGFMGDGATSEADFHCAMNFAAVFRAPCVLICQNNHWSISVPTEQQTASRTLAAKAHAYGMPGLRVDGNDAAALITVIGQAVQRARDGGGPTFIEALTYRIGPHSSSDDPTKYRDEAEVERWRKRDPIARLTGYLLDRGAVSQDELDAITKRLSAEVDEALREVESLGPPTRQTLFEDVFASLPWHLREQRLENDAADSARASAEDA